MPTKNVLVVDNEQDHLDVMRQILEKLGYCPYMAEDAHAALAIIKKHNIPVVITDLIMPDMEGIELCEIIKRLKPNTIIFAYSGHARLYEAYRLERAGFEGCISKPVIIEQVAQTIGDAFALVGQK
ncbi:MAG: response regulator [Desulfobacteraceae bacterium]|jgi:CheY-like chemotaxis protein